MASPRSEHSRQIERSAITALVPVMALVPFWLLALAAVWFPFWLAVGAPFWWFPVGYLVLGLALVVPTIQIALLGTLLGARKPRNEEVDVLKPTWRDLAAKANLPQTRYAIRVIDSDDLNAFACGGHLVIVTSFALTELTPEQVAGVLAHELSHHLGWHTTALTLGHWLSLPVVVLARFGFFLQNVARAATDSYATHSAALTALGRAAALLLTAVSWVFLAALYASDAIANLVGQSSEFEADRRAVRRTARGDAGRAVDRGRPQGRAAAARGAPHLDGVVDPPFQDRHRGLPRS